MAQMHADMAGLISALMQRGMQDLGELLKQNPAECAQRRGEKSNETSERIEQAEEAVREAIHTGPNEADHEREEVVMTNTPADGHFNTS